jgi:hypothetical protein
MTDAGTIATTYFSSWQARDFDTLASLFADEVTFRGPLGKADSAAECIAGIKGMSKMVTDIVVHKKTARSPGFRPPSIRGRCSEPVADAR